MKMNSLRKYIFWSFLFVEMMIVPTIQATPAAGTVGSAHKNVLLLNSYHQNYSWSDNQLNSVFKTFSRQYPDAELFVEHMDVKRFGPEAAQKNARRWLTTHYRPGFFQLVIAIDNLALHLALQLHHELFQDVPIVFCGVNDLTPEMLDGHKNVTGCIVRNDFKQDFALIRRLFPSTRTVWIAGDTGLSGQAQLQLARETVKALNNDELQFNYEFLDGRNLSHEEFRQRLSSLPADSAVILTVWQSDKDHVYLPSITNYQELAKCSTAPVFATLREAVGEGLLGGYVVSGSEQAAAAADIAVRILSGEPASAFPINFFSHQETVLNYNELVRWNVVDRAPENSLFLGRPESLWQQHRLFLLTLAVLLIIQAMVIVLLIRNILRRVQAEQARREQKERLAMILKGVRIAVWEFDLDRDRFMAGENFSEALGVPEPSGLREFIQLIHPEDQPRIQAALEHFFAGDGGELLDLEFRIAGHEDYSWIVMHGYVTARNDQDRPIRIMGIGRNISYRKNMEKELHNSEQEKKLILDNVSEELVFITPDRKIRWANRVFTEAAGREEAGLLGKLICDEIFCGHDCEACPINRSLTSAQLQTMERRFPNGKVKIIKSMPTIGFGGVLSGCVLTIHDVTEQRQGEKNLIAARDEAEAARGRAELANQAKSDFLASISHDVRTPLNGILGMVELLLSTPLNSEQHNYVATIGSTGNAMLKLLNDLLDLSRIEAGKLVLENNPFNLHELLDEVIKLLTPLAGEKQLPIMLELAPPTPAMVSGDVSRLREVLTNLLSNAIKYTERGRITVKVASEHHLLGACQFTFHVTDTGMGMNQEQLVAAFEKYSTLSSPARHRNCGAGLGLTISNQLVKLMGGALQAESVTGEGSDFFFTIPLLLSGQLPPESVPVAAPAEMPDLSRLSVLVAEDSQVNQLVIKDFLVKHFGCRVTIAENGQQVLELLDQGEHYDLILMDCQMPVMDGYSATAAIRASEKSYARIKIVAMTADAMFGSREKCLESGMDAYLAKPIRLNELRQMIHHMVDSSVPPPTP